MESTRWVNQSQPQTLQIAVLILYLRAFFDVLFGIALQMDAVFPADNLLRILFPAAMVAAGFGIANEKKWGYWLGVFTAALPLICRLLLGFGINLDPNLPDLPGISPLDYNAIGLIFEIGLFVLIVHPQSREYQRIWFR